MAKEKKEKKELKSDKSVELNIMLTLTTEMLGTVTKDPEVYRTYIETKKPEDVNEAEYLTVEKIEEKGWTGFHRDMIQNGDGKMIKDPNGRGLFIYDYMIRGFLKHAGNVLKDILKVKNLRSKIDDYVFISPRKIYLGKQEADGVLERPLRAMTMQGPRVTLARSDYVNAGTEINFKIMILPHADIDDKMILELLSYGRLQGLGQFRNGSYGRFTFTASQWLPDEQG